MLKACRITKAKKKKKKKETKEGELGKYATRNVIAICVPNLDHKHTAETILYRSNSSKRS